MSQLLATLDRLTVPAAIVLALVAVALWAIGLLFSSMAAGDALLVALAAAGLAGRLTGPLLHHLVHAPRRRGAWTTRAPVADTDEGPRARTAPTDKESRVSNQSNGLTAAISAVRRLLAAGWESDTVHKVYDGVVGDRTVLTMRQPASGRSITADVVDDDSGNVSLVLTGLTLGQAAATAAALTASDEPVGGAR